jgi:hypothetical protein
MGAIFKTYGGSRVLIAVCTALTVFHPFAGAYVANWIEVVASTHR